MAVDRERLADRLAAVERRLTDAEPDGDGLGDVAAIEGRLAELETHADDLDERLGEVESGLQALRGYVGGVEAVDESVERRADAALAKAEELETLLVEETGLTVERVPTDGDRDDERAESAVDGGRTPDKRNGEPPGGRTGADGGGRRHAAVPDDGPPNDAARAHGGGHSADGERDHADDTGDGLVDRLRDAL